MRDTKQRTAIRNVFKLAGNRILSQKEVQKMASLEVLNIGIATVYRNFKTMEDSGEIKAIELPGQPDRYVLEGGTPINDILINKDGTVTAANLAGVPFIPNHIRFTYFIEE
jgi:Fe2+ or Zn2+ uptake regulation protein